MAYRKKLIEVALPLEAINAASAREKSIRHGHPSTLHLWWARRPLAACRAVLFGQLVDDPSAWPDLFPSEAAQKKERERLFAIIEAMVPWEASNDEKVLNQARTEIARSFARGRLADGEGDDRDKAVLDAGASVKGIGEYLATVVPPVHDPFAGGGSIPLEAQRLGLRAIATDLNPVAVLINKALIEIPPKFAGRAPVGPVPKGEKQAALASQAWPGATGLAEDVRRYGEWLREEAFKRIGHLYPKVKITDEIAQKRVELRDYVGQEFTVIAWLWARTVRSPNPAYRNVHVPLMSSFWLSKKKGRESWLTTIEDSVSKTWRFEVKTGKPDNAKTVDTGTKTGRGMFRCVMSGDVISPDHIRSEAKEGHLGFKLAAIVLEGNRQRIYLRGTDEQESIAKTVEPPWSPDFEFAKNSRHMTPWGYSLDTFGKLFSARQLNALCTFSDLIASVRDIAKDHSLAAGHTLGESLSNGGSDALAYAEAISTYLAMSITKRADRWSSLTIWYSDGEKLQSMIRMNAIPMGWDYGEANPFSESTGNMIDGVNLTVKAITLCPAKTEATVNQRDAISESLSVGSTFTTDPPYYDNVPYADLSDFFYVWLRKMLHDTHPALFQTLLVPKSTELVADPFRHSGKDKAEAFFLGGMRQLLNNIATYANEVTPTAIFYAFKQSDVSASGTSSTGWETFLNATIHAGLSVVGTWPARTEQTGGLRNLGRNSLASSIVLVCRKRSTDAPAITRRDFERALRKELPRALHHLQQGNIAPVDMAQASIGPGMAIFSRHSKVLEANGDAMSVRTALQLINAALDEYLTEQEGEMDPDTRFAVTWFENRQWQPGPYGEAEVLATARAVSVSGIAEAGLLASGGGTVRLLTREELPAAWDPRTDKRATTWEAVQHLIKRLDQGEAAAASLLAALGSRGDQAKDLAYRLYVACERKGWAEEARAYNALVVAWPEIASLAAKAPAVVTGSPQQTTLA